MTVQPTLVAFVVSFVGGPLLCAAFLRMPSSLGMLLGLAAGVALTMAVALWLEDRDPLASLTALWLGWILAVAMVAHALFRRLGKKARRWVFVVALLATPLPWFGLAAAQMMV